MQALQKVVRMEEEPYRLEEDKKASDLVTALQQQVADLEREKADLQASLGKQETEFIRKVLELEKQLRAFKEKDKNGQKGKETDRAEGCHGDGENANGLRTSGRFPVDKLHMNSSNGRGNGRSEDCHVEESLLESRKMQKQQSLRELSLSPKWSTFDRKDGSRSPMERSKSLWRELDDTQRELSQVRAERDFLARKVRLLTDDDLQDNPTFLQRMFPFLEGCGRSWA